MIETGRLLLRPWREDDIAPFAAMGRDHDVMHYLGPLLSDEDVQRTFAAVDRQQRERGFCFWAVERKDDGAFIGFCGLQLGQEPIKNEVEIGWRLARDAWDCGYATEAAKASLQWGWANLDTPTIVAITVVGNRRSRAVMERIGMHYCPDEDFAHPRLSRNDPQRPHVVYRIGRPE